LLVRLIFTEGDIGVVNLLQLLAETGTDTENKQKKQNNNNNNNKL
jgi:hypothetical protein